MTQKNDNSDLKKLADWHIKRADRIKIWRLGNGKSLSDLAKDIGVSVPTLKRIEAGGALRESAIEGLIEAGIPRHLLVIKNPLDVLNPPLAQ